MSGIIGSHNLYIHCAAVVVAELPPAVMIIALERLELLYFVLGIFFTKKHGHHEMVLTHLSVGAFVCILPEHLGSAQRGGFKMEKKEERWKISNMMEITGASLQNIPNCS